jgi:hypothetical protein
VSAPRILLANEAGAGRGHVAKLASVARAFGDGLAMVAALASQKHARELAPHCARVLASPPLSYTSEARANPELEGNASWGDYLAAIGLAREEVVRHGLAWWRAAIVEEDASVLVADYAPLAMRAAQGLKAEGWDIEILAVGTGYGVPPAHLDHFPQLLPDYSRCAHPEAEILALLNRVGRETGLDPLPRLPALYEVDLQLPLTFAFLDPYDGLRARCALVPPVVNIAELVPEASGDELFVYFAAAELSLPGLVEALAALPMKRRGFLPGAAPATLERLAASGMIIEPAPVPVEAITRRSRLMLNAAQHGTLCAAALSGLPQVGLPQHLEQVFHGRRAEARGAMRLLPLGEQTAEAILDLVQVAWSDRALAAGARDLARELRAGYPADPAGSLARRVAPVLARAQAALVR